MKPTLQTLPKEVLFNIWDRVDTPKEPAQRQIGWTGSTSTNTTREATKDRLHLSATCKKFQTEINADWERSKIVKKMQAWVKTVSLADVACAVARSGTSIAPEDMETVTNQVRSFFDEIRKDPTFNKNMKYYVLNDRARRQSTDDHPLKRHGENLAGYLPKPYDSEGASKHIQLCAGFSGSTELFGKTVDLGEGKDKIQILLGYNMSHFGGTGNWEMDIIGSQSALKKVNVG